MMMQKVVHITRRPALRIATVLVAATIVLTAHGWKAQYFHRRFAEVVPGTLFRSSQPRDAQWEFVAARGIRTVIDLRPRAEGPWDFDDEQRGCARNNLRFVSIPVNKAMPDDDQIATFLRICADPDARPVLVHCQHGRRRTSLFVALYRVALDDRSNADALTEMACIYGKPPHPAAAALLKRILDDRELWKTKLASLR